MSKFFTLILLVFSFIWVNAQVEPIPNDFKTPEVNDNLKAGRLDENGYGLFNTLGHPLSITGGLLTLGGAAVYVVGSEMNNNNDNNCCQSGGQPNNYQPQNTTQYIGIGAFVTGAVLFAIFSTERDQNAPKRKKKKQKYSASDWEAQ
ncbi:MAG: hypothetical protein COB15_04435 [Flavobacteriales bacterium]|nr:MAG: hypothetical protein COB15_04435 [Flavobacteriales bacterium]